MTAEGTVPNPQTVPAPPEMERRLRRAIWVVGAALLLSLLGLPALYLTQRYVHSSVSVVDRDLQAVESQIRANPDDPELRVAAANLYTASGRNGDAAAQARQVLAAQPDNVGAALALQAALAAQGRSAEAVEPLARAAQLNRANPLAGSSLELAALQQVLGRLYLEQGRAAEAAEALQSAVAISRADADAWYWLGRAQATSGQLDEASVALLQAVRLVPDFGAAYADLATVDERRGDAAGLLFARGMLDFQAGGYDQAVARLRQAADAAPGLAEPHLGLGMAYEKLGRPTEALVEYRQALALDSSSYAARQAVGRLVGQP